MFAPITVGWLTLATGLWDLESVNYRLGKLGNFSYYLIMLGYFSYRLYEAI